MVEREDQRGSTTAEFAVVLPCVALLVAVVAAAGAGGRAQLQCQDAAWTAARLAARGEAPGAAIAAAGAVAPSGVRVALSGDDRTVTAMVTGRVSLLPGDGRWQLGVSCSSTAWREVGGASVGGSPGGLP